MSELTGVELDLAVAKAKYPDAIFEERWGFDDPECGFPELTPDNDDFYEGEFNSRLLMSMKVDGHWEIVPAYSTDSAHLESLMTEYCIEFDAPNPECKCHEGGCQWYARIRKCIQGGEGPTPLIAACRAIVASKEGDQ